MHVKFKVYNLIGRGVKFKIDCRDFKLLFFLKKGCRRVQCTSIVFLRMDAHLGLSNRKASSVYTHAVFFGEQYISSLVSIARQISRTSLKHMYDFLWLLDAWLYA